jgi:cysteine synthase A
MSRSWVYQAIDAINADFQRSADTHMVKVDLPFNTNAPIYFKDESTHPSGSLKHRLARSLFLYGLCNGWIDEGTTIVEASSGSTAVSEAYFARILRLPFIAVVPGSTSPQKLEQIRLYGGQCHLAQPDEDICEVSKQLAAEIGGHFMDQFTFAERATDWRGNNNIAESLFAQLEREPVQIPSAIVVGAGTGGTSATIGRYIRYNQLETELVVVDPERSVFADYFSSGDATIKSSQNSRIEGIGRPFVVASFLRDVVDTVVQVPDRDSIAAMLFLERLLGRRVGASTGTNLIGAIETIARHSRAGQPLGPVVTLICDSGERYRDTYYSPEWRQSQDLASDSRISEIEQFFETGDWPDIAKNVLPRRSMRERTEANTRGGKL